jgi:hypothetical protein
MTNPEPPTSPPLFDFTSAADEFFSRVGYAITRWAHIDRSLFNLCDYAIGANKEMASAIFYKSPNIGDHLALANTLLGYCTDEKQQNIWSKIYLRIEGLLPFRNALAHNPPTQNTFMKIALDVGSNAPSSAIISALPKAKMVSPDCYWSIRTEQSKLLHKNKKSKEVNIRKEEIIDHIGSVNDLLKSLREFEASLPQPRALTPAKSSSLARQDSSKRG